MGNKFYTPDGFTDQVPGFCAFKRDMEARLRNLFLMNGYEEIETPGIEYFDVYRSFVAEEELYKFSDGKGRLLCTRYDGTIPVARYAAGRNDTMPTRLFYIENMYRAGQIGGGKQSGFTQAGIELLGASGSKSDAEVLALAIKSALELGITDLQVSLGQVQFFKGLSRQLGLNDETIAKIKTAIANTMRSGAEGIKVQISGRLNGAEIARSEMFKEGRTPLHTLRADIDYSLAEALTKVGLLGIKVWICRGEKFGKQDLTPNFSQQKDSARGGNNGGGRRFRNRKPNNRN